MSALASFSYPSLPILCWTARRLLIHVAIVIGAPLSMAACTTTDDEGSTPNGPADNFFAVTDEVIEEIDNETAAPTDVLVECDDGTDCESALHGAVGTSPLVRTDIELPIQLIVFSDVPTQGLTNQAAYALELLNGSALGPEGAGFRFTCAPEDQHSATPTGDMVSVSDAISLVRAFHADNPDHRREDRMPIYYFSSGLSSSGRPLGGFAQLPGFGQWVRGRASGVYIAQFSALTHEVGHWLGLHHTFRGGCNPILGGDLVQDTPVHTNGRNNRYVQNSPCNGTLDTCPGAGVDPVTNMMSYADCGEELTPGQIIRVRNSWNRHYADRFGAAFGL